MCGGLGEEAMDMRRVAWILKLLFVPLLIHSSCAQEKTLPPEELEVLKVIGSKLNAGWNHDVNPCIGEKSWNFTTRNGTGTDGSDYRGITCGDCDSNTNVCHVISITFRGQNLAGMLPEEFGNLTHLQEIVLPRNYLNGTIPALAWSKAPLTNINLLGNRLNGRIPREIGNITTLTQLNLEDNRFRKKLPTTLGKLTNLTRLLVSCNFLNGTLPKSLQNLKKLRDVRIDGNDISGNIDVIGNWTKLQTLYMQGTSLGGAFPSSFSTFNLTDLIVSDFNGDGNFPPLQNMAYLDTLVLRNCSLSGTVPEYISSMEKLSQLDLSFNRFTGEPPDFNKSAKIPSYMYLNNNMFNGSIPESILRITRTKTKTMIDVSHNSFVLASGQSVPSDSDSLNLAASYSSQNDIRVNNYFREGLPCPGEAQNFELFINCGGKNINYEGDEYEDDSNMGGPALFHLSESKRWAFSTAGRYFSAQEDRYRTDNVTTLTNTQSPLYTSARLSPSSLKYYGLCLKKGSYAVKLHFAEIMFTNDTTFSSLGRRVFDIFIQGELVKEDFNIADEANGVGKEVILQFHAVVENSTLEIELRWSGKGTTALPRRGVYGPLISAISVKSKGHGKLSTGVIVGIAITSCLLAALIILLILFCVRRHRRYTDLKVLDLQSGIFSLRQIMLATDNFSPKNKIGQGGFGSVYKGVFPNNTLIAVKQLSSKSSQGNREFVNEIGIISALQHPNLVKLYGCCKEWKQLMLVYEYMENNSLALALFGSEETRLKLDWQRRRKICIGVARGLAYLHDESRLKIVHRDIKATNILLDKDLNPKISDFGLARLHDEDKSHISTGIAGTEGYMAPEYVTKGYLTDKADVYSFGVVMLEIVSGKRNTNYEPDKSLYILDVANALKVEGRLLELVDPNLGSDYSKEEAEKLLNLALACTDESPNLRPTMSEVVSKLDVQIGMPSIIIHGSKENEHQELEIVLETSNSNQALVSSSDEPSGSHATNFSNSNAFDSSAYEDLELRN